MFCIQLVAAELGTFYRLIFSPLLHAVKPPGSPVPSPFSSLPDMSPKKVSAKHNVYVSPLRSSKVSSSLLIFSSLKNGQLSLEYSVYLNK
jgi:hypothetical protein